MAKNPKGNPKAGYAAKDATLEDDDLDVAWHVTEMHPSISNVASVSYAPDDLRHLLSRNKKTIADDAVQSVSNVQIIESDLSENALVANDEPKRKKRKVVIATNKGTLFVVDSGCTHSLMMMFKDFYKFRISKS